MSDVGVAEVVEEMGNPIAELEADVTAVNVLLDQAVQRLVDIQEQLPEDAQPLVVYITDIVERIGDTIEFLFDTMIDTATDGSTPDVEEAVNVVADDESQRPDDLRDLTMAARHIPGVEDHHLVRIARLADTLASALAQTIAIRDKVVNNPVRYAEAFRPEDELLPPTQQLSPEELAEFQAQAVPTEEDTEGDEVPSEEEGGEEETEE